MGLRAAQFLVRVLVPLAALVWAGAGALAGEVNAGEAKVGGEGVVATAARVVAVAAGGGGTEFRLDMSAGVPVEVYTLANPYRVVIDLPGIGFKLDPLAGQAGGGLVTAYRFGALAGGQARIVIDTAGPVAITKAVMTNIAASGGRPAGGVRLAVGLASMDARAFGEGTGAAKAAAKLPAVKPAVFEDADAGQAVKSRPVVMIDPGHGGIDPGAVGGQKTTEKTVVLAVALRLRAALEAGGRFDVRLTRADDVFVPLDKRVELSRTERADIFISLHADAIEDSAQAKAVRGASIYTLSDKASDEQARMMADKENAADLVAGFTQVPGENPDEIKGILFDLMNRETAVFSHVLSRALTEAMGKSGALAREPERAAAFRVLKQAHAPSVLVELGFLSNPVEEQMMMEAGWQSRTAKAIAAAVEAYFTAKARAGTSVPARAALGRLPP